MIPNLDIPVKEVESFLFLHGWFKQAVPSYSNFPQYVWSAIHPIARGFLFNVEEAYHLQQLMMTEILDTLPPEFEIETEK